MTFNFTVKEFIIGGGNATPTLQFYRRGFNLGDSGSQPSWQNIILSGNTALTLVNSKADGLNYLKLFGGTEQRNLPEGHQQVEYLQGDGTAYIETNVKPTNNTGMKIVFEYGASGSAATSGIYDSSAPRQDTFFISTNSGSIDNSVAFIAHRGTTLGTGTTHTETPVQGKTYTININYKNSGTMGIEGFTQTDVGTNDVLPNKVLLFARLNYNNDNITASTCKIKYVEFTEGTEVIRKYYPDSYNNELGLYDTVTNTFLTNKNSLGSFTAGTDVVPTPDTPMDIVCNNGVVKVNRNLYSTEYHNKTLSQTDGVATINNSGVNVSGMVDCRTIKSFKITTISSQGSFRIFKYGADNTFINAGSTSNIGDIVTFENNVGFFRIQYNYTSGNVGTENILIYNSAYSLNGIYTDGTTETVEITGKNLFDKEQPYLSAYVNANTGVITEASGRQRSFVVDCLPNTTYTLSGMTAASGWGSFTSSTIGTTTTSFTAGNGTITTGANDKYLIGMAYVEGGGIYDYRNTLQIEQGSTATDYEPYTVLGTATAENLFKVGTYQDVQSVLDSVVTRKVGVKVLDGTENWTRGTAIYANIPDLDAHLGYKGCYCTHFLGVNNSRQGAALENSNKICVSDKANTSQYRNSVYIYGTTTDFPDVTTWKQYLADQYNAGTPVIVLYPLATPTTETVTGQSLTTQAGTNIVEITQASIDNLGLEVSYKATV